MLRLKKISGFLSAGFNGIALFALAAMMFLTSADVILRYFGFPIDGTYEIVCFLGAMAASFALGKTTLNRGHVAVDLVTKMLPGSLKSRMDLFTQTISLGLFAAISWESFKYGKELWESKVTYGTIELPIYPIVYGVAFAFSLGTLTLLAHILETASGGNLREK